MASTTHANLTTTPQAGVARHHAATLDIERPIVESCVASHLRPRALVALCCEPGMAEGDVLERAFGLVAGWELRVEQLDLSLSGGDACCSRASRLLRRMRSSAREGELGCVVLERVPSLDEGDVARLAGVVRRMLDAGLCVVLTLLPEAMQLLEELRTALVFWSEDLLVDGGSGTGACLDEAGVSLSRGLPLLVRGYLRTPHPCRRPGRGYVDAMGNLVGLSLRDGLLEEERRLRLAMMLLGSGRLEDVAHVVGRVDEDIVRSMQRDAPLFGVDVATQTFCCAGLSSLPVFEECAASLAPYATGREDVARSCVGRLLASGEARRAAQVVSLLSDDGGARKLCLAFCAELADAGRLDLVQAALASKDPCTSDADEEIERAAGLLVDVCRGGRVGEGRVRALAQGSDASRHARSMVGLLASSRLVVGGVQVTGTPVPPPAGRLARRLVAHLDAQRLLVRGRFREAYRLLLEEPLDEGDTTLSGALLAADLALAGTLSLDPDAARALAGVQWGRLASVRGLTPYAGMVRDLSRVVAGGSYGWSAVASSHAERAGDAVLRASAGERVAGGLGLGWLGESCRIVRWAAAARGGSRPEVAELEAGGFSSEGVASLARVLAIGAGHGGLAPLPDDLPLDRDLLWLVCALCEGMGPLSESLARDMPPSWRRAVADARALWPAAQPSGAPRLGVPAARAEAAREAAAVVCAEPGPLVDVRVLGEMRVSVNGRVVPEALLSRRRGMAMLSFVATKESHRAQRYRIVEALWPEDDYVRGNKCIYQATSAVNHALREMGSDARPFVKSPSERSIALDPAIVHCDLDDFLAVGRRALTGRREDAAVLEDARMAAGLYTGDLYVSSFDASGDMARRRDALRALFLDVMVAGAAAAGRLRAFGSAIYLAERAVRADDLREDAHECLLRSLIASGREAEAMTRYTSYALRCVERLKRPPSRQLRDLMALSAPAPAASRQRAYALAP